ncbi:MAG: hypothetical protein J6X28_05470, partial [Bacilli bacterium]|nr:hypothetical protein [Bacilli bacterium]
EELIKELKEALDKKDIEEIKTKKDKLQEKAMALATKVYEEAAKQRQAEESSNEDEDEEEEKKDKKKDKKKKKKDDDVEEADIEEE